MASLVPNHVFGLSGGLKDSVKFVDDTTYVYVAGHNLVLINTELKHQKVISGSPETDGITAVAVSPSKRYVAVAERCLLSQVGATASPGASDAPRNSVTEQRGSLIEQRASVSSAVGPDGKPVAVGDGKAAVVDVKGPIITIYEASTLKKRRVLSGSEVLQGTREYTSICFSSDGKTIAAQGGPPDYVLVIWSLDKLKVLSFCKASSGNATIDQILYCPEDSSHITVVGREFAKTFRSTDMSLRQIANALAKRDGHRFPCHVWLSEPTDPDEEEEETEMKQGQLSGCLYSCDTAELLYVEGGEIVCTIPTSSDKDAVSIVEIIVLYSKGFLCGEQGGNISMWERVEEAQIKEGFKRVKSFKVDASKGRICSMAISPNEDMLVCALHNNQLITIPFQNEFLFKENEIPKDILIQPFHFDKITGMDACVRKPVAVSCSTDKSVRIWNYVEKRCELCKYFSEEAYSISLHPSGLHILVGFSDKLRLMNLLIDDIKTTREFSIKACHESTFSNGGQYFAAVNSNAIQIFSTYTCENVGNLRGHGGKVRTIWWSPDDSTIVSAGVDGAIYEWRVKDYKRLRENVNKGTVYTSAIGVIDGKSFFAVGSDKKLKEVDEIQVLKEYTSTVLLTQIFLPHSSRLLFAGTQLGGVRAYRYPLTGEFQEVQASTGAITRISVCCNESILLTAGEDGVIMVFDIRDKEKAIANSILRREKDAMSWADEVLVPKVDLEEMRGHATELEQMVKELQNQNEYQIRLKDIAMHEQIKELTDNFQKQLDESTARYEQLVLQKNEEGLEVEDKQAKAEERHMKHITELEDLFQQKMLVEVGRYEGLSLEKKLENENWQEQNIQLVEKHERVLQDLTEDFEAKLQIEQKTIQQLLAELEQLKLDFAEIKRQTEEDTDLEIEDIKEKYEAIIVVEKEAQLRLKGENSIMKKKFNEFLKDIEEQKNEIRALFEQKKELYQAIAAFERDIAQLKRDIVDRDETIGEKEKRIYELKRKNQELEKFKYVLDNKIKDLKLQIEPREIELHNCKIEMQNMEKELERSHHAIAKKDLVIGDLKQKLDGLTREDIVLRRVLQDRNNFIRYFGHDVYELGQHITVNTMKQNASCSAKDALALKSAVKSLYAKYVTDKAKAVVVDDDLQKETTRQRDYLERTVTGLQHKKDKDDIMHHIANLRLMHENVVLIKELNELRRELRSMKMTSHKGGPSKVVENVEENRVENKLQLIIIEKIKEIEKMVEQMKQLKCELEVKQERIEYLEYLIAESERVNRRPGSREELPPMDEADYMEESRMSPKLESVEEEFDDPLSHRSDANLSYRSEMAQSEASSEDVYIAMNKKVDNINTDVKQVMEGMVSMVESKGPKACTRESS